MSDASDFEKYRPKITEVTMVQAAQSCGAGAEILSLDGKGVALNSFLLQLATDSETPGPFLLNATCARALCALLLEAGFAPKG